MILAFDTYYYEDKAKTVCVAFENWTQAEPSAVYTEFLEGIEEYTSGEFYKRELPCITSLLKQIDLNTIELIIVDGFVFLDDEAKFGLGAYLHKELVEKIPIIGIAKNNFATIVDLKKVILRGESKKPLYGTAIGIELVLIEGLIKSMHGEFRMPTLLKKLDQLSREI